MNIWPFTKKAKRVLGADMESLATRASRIAGAVYQVGWSKGPEQEGLDPLDETKATLRECARLLREQARKAGGDGE